MIATVSYIGYVWNRIRFAKVSVDTGMMNALVGKLEAIAMTKPDRKTTSSEKQAKHLWCR